MIMKKLIVLVKCADEETFNLSLLEIGELMDMMKSLSREAKIMEVSEWEE